MTPEDFNLLSSLLKLRSGLDLSEDKIYLLESRLTPIARRRGLNNLDELVEEIRIRKPEPLILEVTEAMTTNESFFFRDDKPFTTFREKLLPRLIEARSDKKSLRIWCAAASSGQEPYSLCMILKEFERQLAGWRIDILGTDISPGILERAKDGIYSQFEVQRGLPVQLLVKYFKQEGEKWRIDQSIRDMVTYRELNLLEDFKSLGQFDVIYCRNVLIYFDRATKANVLDRMEPMLPNDGIVVLGAAETVVGITDKFQSVPELRGIYIPSRGQDHQEALRAS